MIVYKGQSSASSSSSKSTICARPSGTIMEGDILIAQVNFHLHSNVKFLTGYPSGWTLLHDENNSNISMAILYKVATASETLTYTFSYSSSASNSVRIAHFSTDSGVPTNLGVYTSQIYKGNTAPALSVPSGSPYMYLSFFGAHQSSGTIAPATNVAQVWNGVLTSYTLASMGYKWYPNGGTSLNSAATGTKPSVLSMSVAIYEVNKVPTTPGKISGVTEKVYLKGETIPLTWGASTDPDGDSITYAIEIYDGIEWVALKSEVPSNSTTITMPKDIHTPNSKLRIKAVDSKMGSSLYSESIVFALYRVLYLITDKDTKGFNGTEWRKVQ